MYTYNSGQVFLNTHTEEHQLMLSLSVCLSSVMQLTLIFFFKFKQSILLAMTVFCLKKGLTLKMCACFESVVLLKSAYLNKIK